MAAARPAAAPSTAANPSGLPLALYIHIPWCVRKCPYCDFNSHASDDPAGTIPEETYVEALLADLESALPLVWGRKAGSVFIGGGTPSLLSADALDRLLAGVRMRLPLIADAEITLEANPGTFEADKFRGFRAAGVNRLSLGIQSFDPQQLKALGRIHDGEQARAAAALAGTLFANFNLDLMYGLPGQTVAQALADVDTALSFGPTHLSCYQLTLEPNTPFFAAPPELPADDTCADMQDAIEARLAAAGFGHYETSAFARPGQRCRHNLNYWQFGDYLGIGAGAHGKLTLHDRILRQMRHKSPRAYLDAARSYAQSGVAKDFLQVNEEVPADALPFEFMMNALRLLDGVPTPLFAERCRLDAKTLNATFAIVEQARREGWMVDDPTRLAPTERGRRFLNPLLQRFLT
ncbi:MAG TPA: radical SAM family heme chaperone HemW [Rhodocyclaceae bacterium]|nr:radical SAM family heme chaperone HemW [Rhodocyclaceae bacterium]